MGCLKDCFEGTSYAKRNVNFKGDVEKNLLPSIEYIEILAQNFADLNQENIVIYVRNEMGKGKFYDFEPKTEGRKTITKTVKFHRKDKSSDVLQDSGNKQPESAKSTKKKSKPTKAE